VSTQLATSDSYCRRLAAQHYENFWVLAAAPSGTTRAHLARIYAYCRYTDDLGDETGEDAPRLLADWRRQVEEWLAGRPTDHLVLTALGESRRQLRLPAEPFLDLIAANEQDQTRTSYATWGELHAYCLLSAAPVGRLVLRVFETWSRAAERLSDDVCVGLQLANFAQDVSVDWARGRNYLLGEDLELLGAVGAVRRMSERAAELLASGRRLEAMVPRALRLQLALYRLGGEAILDAIRETGYATASTRPTVSSLAKLRLAATAARQIAWAGRREAVG
jgi:squalene synthase HpnC